MNEHEKRRDPKWLRRSNMACLAVAGVCLGIAVASIKYASNAQETSVHMMTANAQLFNTVQYERAEAGRQAGNAYGTSLALSEMEARASKAEGYWSSWKQKATEADARAARLQREVCQLSEIARSNGVRLIRNPECKQ